MFTHIIITSRYNSTRIPGKAMAEIEGVPMLVRCYNQCAKTGFQPIVATTYDSIPILDLCEREGIPYCYIDDEDDILARLVKAIELYPCQKVIRVWGDSPLISPSFIWQAWVQANSSCATYSMSKSQHGEIVSVCDSQLYLELNKKITEPKDREWIHKYISENYPTARHGFHESHVVDTPEDLERVRRIVRECQPCHLG